MNPFESARIEAIRLRAELAEKGVDLAQAGYPLVEAACKALDVTLKKVKSTLPLLKGSDATINVGKKWTLVRNDVSDDFKAFLVAHELGHLRLHPLTPGTVEVKQEALTGETETNGVKEVESYGARERQELQANVFAREFLLPRQIARGQFLGEGLAASRIADQRKLPEELVRLQMYDAVLLPLSESPGKVFTLPEHPTPAQEPAVDSDAATSLVEAGPGTGKTTTLLLRLRRLLAQGIAPESIVILTFSNKAARELVERARAGNIVGADRVWIGTFHAFGLEFLRKFGDVHGLGARFPVLDKLAALAMLEADLPSLELKAFDPLSNPSPWLETAIDTIRRAKDEVYTASEFANAVAAKSSGDADVDAKRNDVATIFQRYELLLSRRKAVDLNDLLCVSIRLMQSDDVNVERFVGRIQHLMVDEYQDVNRASALLVKQLSRRTQTLWVVGDANQAIYAFMGASTSNLANFQADFPGARTIPLTVNHRSSQEIVDTFCAVAKHNPAGRPTFDLLAERKQVGHRPKHIRTSGDEEEVNALAWRIRELEKQGTVLAEQAIIVYQNASAAEIALGLEALGVPVLYLGNIFERAEVKDLMCLLQLAVDEYGMNLVRPWRSPLLMLTRAGADLIFEQTRTQQLSWREVSGEGLCAEDLQALTKLRQLCALVSANASPWEALASILLEHGEWLRELAGRQGQAAANAMMAVWQFVHFCRSPDGTGRWATVKNLPQRIRDRVRLGEDRSMRAVPPEAEGMNAVRVLTAHGSKGLEFDAVHFLRVTKNTFEPSRTNSNRLLPDSVLKGQEPLAVLKNERHNLLYVAVSRPRFYLMVYSHEDDELPGALNGILQSCSAGWSKPATPAPIPYVTAVATEVSLQQYLDFVKCPARHEMISRAGGSPRDEMKLNRAIDVATGRVTRALAGDHALLQDSQWPGVVGAALADFKLDAHPAARAIRERVMQRVQRARDLLLEGGERGVKVDMKLGPLQVALEPDQVFESGGLTRIRFIRTSESGFTSMKQPLAALLDAHHRAGGAKSMIEVSTLATGNTLQVGKVQEATRSKYLGIADGLCAKQFPAAPESDRICHFCAYMFPCDKRVSD